MIYNNEYIDFICLDEATGFETVPFTKQDEVPSEFKDLAINVAKTAEDIIGRKIGEGVLDAALGRLFYRFRNSIERIKKDNKNRAAYVFIIPQKLMINLSIDSPKKYADLAEKILTKCQFKKGQAIDNMPNTRYFYKYSKDKKRIFLSCYTSTTSVVPGTVTAFQLRVQCVDNTEDARSFLVENSIFESTIFESVELI